MILLVVMGFVLVTCEKGETTPQDNSSDIEIMIGSVKNIGYHEATITGEIGETYGQKIYGFGHCWDTRPQPTVEEIDIGFGMTKTKKTFTTTLENLLPNQHYYVRAYYKIDKSIVYSSETNFITLEYKEPAVTTKSITNITETSATAGGSITDDGGSTIISRGVCWNTIGNPTINDNKTIDGSGKGSFTSELTNLIAEQEYHVRAFATNSYGTGYGKEVLLLKRTTGTMTDYDGNTYKTVKIGDQWWMAENLKVIHYPNGTAIPLVTDNTDWINLGSNDDAYCFYNNDTNGDYGALYTYEASKASCPTGWHLPTEAEWTKLKNYISNGGHQGTEGIALKAANGWAGNGNGTDDYGFSALPGGMRYTDTGEIGNMGIMGHWRGTSVSDYLAYDFYLYSYCDTVMPYNNYYKSSGQSVRCIKD